MEGKGGDWMVRVRWELMSCRGGRSWSGVPVPQVSVGSGHPLGGVGGEPGPVPLRAERCLEGLTGGHKL